MEEQKDCAFQFVVSPKWGSVKFIKDTDLITLTEAKELYKKYLLEFIKNLQNDQNPEMGIWIGMKNNTDYKESLVHLDKDWQTDGENLWINKKEYAPSF